MAAQALSDKTTVAQRFRPPGWRDPRFVVGMGLIAVSVLAGAWLLAAADHTETAWMAREDVAAGTVIEVDTFEPVSVRLPAALREAYLVQEQAPAAGLVAQHFIAAGELAPSQALAQNAPVEVVEVPVSVLPEDVPAAVQSGSIVDVWVATDAGQAQRVLTDMVVVSVEQDSNALAPQLARQIVLGLPVSEVDELAQALGALSQGRPVIVRKASR